MGRLTRAAIYARTVGARGIAGAALGGLAGHPRLLEMRHRDMRHPFWVRVPSTDVPTLDQIVVRREYAFDVGREPRVIVDAGANVGLASIYFASRFPDARIVAIEPEAGNAQLLERNAAPYANIRVVRAALWHENARLQVVDPGLGEWGFRTRAPDAAPAKVVQEVEGVTLDALCERLGLERIDILKMDIEGAELEVFSRPAAWIGRVDGLIVELHDWLRPGCGESFRKGATGFDAQWRQGENVYASRPAGCLRRPALGRPVDSR